MVAGWAFLSFLRLQHHFLLQPEGGHCGVRGRIFQTKLYPVKEVSVGQLLPPTTHLTLLSFVIEITDRRPFEVENQFERRAGSIVASGQNGRQGRNSLQR
jgi:hypothetical protein